MAITKSIDEVKFRIPRQILETVFTQRSINWKQRPTPMEEQIMSLVVRPRVLIDCNLVGGTEIFVSLEGLQPERPEDFISVYNIPKTLTQNRSILSVLNISFNDPTRIAGYQAVAQHQATAMLQAGSAVMDAHSPMPMTSTAQVQLIGENVVMVRDTVILPANVFLRCRIANDENMSHLQLRSYRAFARLVELAVKSFIYQQYVVEMDMGQIKGGVMIGKFKEVVESYADSEELYQTYLTEKWEKISFMNDQETYTRFLRLGLGGYR